MNTTPNDQKSEAEAREIESQRRHARVPFQVEVTVESDHNFYNGFSSNISEGGLFIATNRVMPVGSKIAFTFRLDTFPEPIGVEGTVRWIRESNRFTDDSPAGMGVQFQDLHPAVAQRINHFINRERDTIFYDD